MEIKNLQNEIGAWADSVFPQRTLGSAMLKLFEEVGELIKHPHNPEEHADIYIMMFDISRMHGIDIADAIRKKMEINKAREWEVTSHGTMQHLAENHDWVPYNEGVDDYVRGKSPRSCTEFFDIDSHREYIKGYRDAQGEGEGDACD